MNIVRLLVSKLFSRKFASLIPKVIINGIPLVFSSCYNYYRLGIFSNSINVESSNVCQLKCPECATAKGEIQAALGHGYLSFTNFKAFVDKHPISNIELSNWGEMFLNPHLVEILEYAHLKNISLTANNGVNFNAASDKVIESLVKFKFKKMTVSIDGASNDTYEIYRKRGNFDKVIENIKKLNSYKEKYQSNLPILKWQFVIFGHNENDLPVAMKMAENLNMEFSYLRNAFLPYSPIVNRQFVKDVTGMEYLTSHEYEETTERPTTMACHQLWTSPQVNFDGKLLGCCWNHWGDFGNVFETSLKDCLKSEKYVQTKNMLLGRSEIAEDSPCLSCPVYEKVKTKPNIVRDVLIEQSIAQVIG